MEINERKWGDSQLVTLTEGMDEITVSLFPNRIISIWISEKGKDTNIRLDYNQEEKTFNLEKFKEME